jgi:predicted lactoylglutathione lyase
MIGYVTVGTNDLARAAKFYDALLAEIGARRMMESERLVAWMVTPDKPGFGVIKPWDGNAATNGNGCMTAFVVESPAQVDQLYRKARELGARDEGPPGPRQLPGFYVGYCRDLDGNKLNFFCMQQG